MKLSYFWTVVGLTGCAGSPSEDVSPVVDHGCSSMVSIAQTEMNVAALLQAPGHQTLLRAQIHDEAPAHVALPERVATQKEAMPEGFPMESWMASEFAAPGVGPAAKDSAAAGPVGSANSDGYAPHPGTPSVPSDQVAALKERSSVLDYSTAGLSLESGVARKQASQDASQEASRPETHDVAQANGTNNTSNGIVPTDSGKDSVPATEPKASTTSPSSLSNASSAVAANSTPPLNSTAATGAEAATTTAAPTNKSNASTTMSVNSANANVTTASATAADPSNGPNASSTSTTISVAKQNSTSTNASKASAGNASIGASANMSGNVTQGAAGSVTTSLPATSVAALDQQATGVSAVPGLAPETSARSSREPLITDLQTLSQADNPAASAHVGP